ncbi:MAG: hypothetical protein IIZ80_04215 [Erysipelotrichaceae bacterium]|nr:hypothetical protein [Erysipelotrichaceae bacterium]
MATFIACLCAYLLRKRRFHGYPLLSAFMIAAINGVIIGTELGYIFKSVDMIPIYICCRYLPER